MVADGVYEIVVSPTGGSTGKNLAKLITCLDLFSRFPIAVVSDVECNDNRTWAHQSPFTSTSTDIVAYAELVSQFDWATFFFFREATLFASVNHCSFDALFDGADLVVRAVDGEYFYVYSPTPDDVFGLRQFFAVEAQQKRRSEIVHPF